MDNYCHFVTYSDDDGLWTAYSVAHPDLEAFGDSMEDALAAAARLVVESACGTATDL